MITFSIKGVEQILEGLGPSTLLDIKYISLLVLQFILGNNLFDMKCGWNNAHLCALFVEEKIRRIKTNKTALGEIFLPQKGH